MKSAPNLTSILRRVSRGDEAAVTELFPLVYEELRGQAARQMAKERRDHTLQATALVHDAYIKLIGAQIIDWESRRHFFAVAAGAMRRILVDHARSRACVKRGGDRKRIQLEDCVDQKRAEQITPDQLLDLDDALRKLESTDPQVAEMVRLRLYAGLSVAEAAKLINLSRTKGYELWVYALAWFDLELFGSDTA